jgi:hypothetical protein
VDQVNYSSGTHFGVGLASLMLGAATAENPQWTSTGSLAGASTVMASFPAATVSGGVTAATATAATASITAAARLAATAASASTATATAKTTAPVTATASAASAATGLATATSRISASAAGATAGTVALNAPTAITATSAGVSAAIAAIKAAALIGDQAYASVILGDSPSSYWRMDDTGTTLVDQMGVAPMALTGGYTESVPGLLLGDPDTAVTFDGINGFGVAAVNALSNPAGGGSVEAWIQTTGVTGFAGIVCSQGSWAMFMNGGNLWAYDWGAATGRNTGFKINDGKVHHVAITWQSGVTNGTLCYVDGNLVFTTTTTTPNTAAHTAIGSGSSGGSQYFPGTIDEPAAYSYVLSPTQITAHYLSGSTTLAMAKTAATATLRAAANLSPTAAGASTATANVTAPAKLTVTAVNTTAATNKTTAASKLSAVASSSTAATALVKVVMPFAASASTVTQALSTVSTRVPLTISAVVFTEADLFVRGGPPRTQFPTSFTELQTTSTADLAEYSSGVSISTTDSKITMGYDSELAIQDYESGMTVRRHAASVDIVDVETTAELDE